MTKDPTAEIQLPAIFKSNLPEPTEVAAQFREAFGSIYTKIEAEIASADVDLTTKKGRVAVASLAHKIAKTKTGLERAANSLTEEQKAMVKVVISERQEMSATLDKLRDRAREPLNKWEEQEEWRVTQLENAIEELRDLGRVDAMINPDKIKEVIEALKTTHAMNDWDEYEDQAEAAFNIAFDKFTADLTASEKRIADEAELAELRAKAAEQQRRDDEAKAEQERKDAAAKAEQERKDAAAKADADELKRQRVAKEQADKDAADRVKAERERADQAVEDAKKAEADRAAAQKKYKADRLAAKEKAEVDKKAAAEFAVNEERNRQALIAAGEREAEEARAADLKHRKKINNAALEALIKCSEITDAQGQMIIRAMARGQVPHVKISY